MTGICVLGSVLILLFDLFLSSSSDISELFPRQDSIQPDRPISRSDGRFESISGLRKGVRSFSLFSEYTIESIYRRFTTDLKGSKAHGSPNPAAGNSKTKAANQGNDITADYVKVLFIGDSVDRNSMIDWCEQNKGNLSVVDEEVAGEGHLHEKLVRIKAARMAHTNLGFCVHHQRKISVSLVFNKFGIVPQLWCSGKSHNDEGGFNEKHLRDANRSHLYHPAKKLDENPIYPCKQFYSHYLLPGIETILEMNDYHLDGILFQSSFWDIAKYYECHEYDRKPVFTTDVIIEFSRNWTRHMEQFMTDFILPTFRGNESILSQHVGPSGLTNDSLSEPLLGYRTNNAVKHNVMKEWISKGPEILGPMRENAMNLSMKYNISVMDFYSFPLTTTTNSNYLRDLAHPSEIPSGLLCEAFIQEVLKWRSFAHSAETQQYTKVIKSSAAVHHPARKQAFPSLAIYNHFPDSN